MAITKTVKNVDSSVVSVNNWQPADKSDFALIDSSVNGENREAVYQRILDDDNIDIPNTVRVGYYPKNGAKPTSNRSVKATYYVEVADSVTGITTYEPLVVTLAVTGPGLSGGLDAAAFTSAIHNTVSWLMPVVTGAMALDAINQLKYGVVNALHTLAD